MKTTMKNLFSILLIALTLVTVTSCGDEENDPKPTTPTTPVYVGYWKFQSAVVTPKNGNEYTVTSLCTSKQNPQFNGEFDVTSKTEAIQKSPCFADAALTYTSTIVDNKLTAINFKDSGAQSFTFDNIVINESAKTITANQTFPMGSANTIVVTFKLQ